MYEAANTLKNPLHKPSTSSFITYKMHRWFLKWKLISYNKRTLARPTTDERMNGDGEPATGNNTLSAFSASSLWDYDRTARQYQRQPAKKHATTGDQCSQISLKCSEKKMNDEPIKFSCNLIIRFCGSVTKGTKEKMQFFHFF